MRHRVLCLAMLAGLAAAPGFAQTGEGTPSSQQIIQQLTRGIRVGPTTGAPPQIDPQQRSEGTTAPAGVPAISISVTFASGSAAITPQAEQALAALGEALASAELASYRFRIEGHTDTVGDARTNQSLSERRAAAVATWLIRRYRIAPERLEARGHGEAELLVATPDNTPEPRNRRVQVLNLLR